MYNCKSLNIGDSYNFASGICIPSSGYMGKFHNAKLFINPKTNIEYHIKLDIPFKLTSGGVTFM